MRDKKIFHILNMLERFAKGEEISTSALACELDISLRTIQRYIEEIRGYFGKDSIKKSSNGSYIALNPKLIERLLPSNPKELENLERLLDIVYISGAPLGENLPKSYKSLATKIQKEFDEIFLVRNNAFEEFSNYSLLKTLKVAILQKRYCDVVYSSDTKMEFLDIKPLKVLFAEGNWYLATMSDGELNGGFRLLRISFIESVEIKSQTFHKDIRALKFCEEFQTLFSSFEESYFDVEVLVESDISRFFVNKRHLKSQEIVEHRSDGALVIKYKINNKLEIFNLAKRWLPHIKIVSPKELDSEFRDIISRY